MSKNLLTHNSKVSLVEQVYFAPTAVVSGTTKIINTIYCFLAQIVPWTIENNPDVPEQNQKYIKKLFKNIFVVKKIKSSDISPVIQRIDWQSGIVYDAYTDDLDLLTKDVNGYNNYNYYIKNKYDQIFKCLWNNKGGPSTIEPVFQPGTYGANNLFADADGYKWKYIYSISVGSKTKFMDKSWLPIPVGNFTPNPISTPAGSGSIDVINLINGGSGFNPTLATIFVDISGDGTGAQANAIVDTTTGIITDIQVTNAGTNYTYATVRIHSSVGSGCIALAPTSPIGGHGFDPISELGCNHVMYTVEFNGKETYDGIDYVPTNIDYRQIGLLTNPTSKSTYPDPANKEIYKASTDLIVAGGFGLYIADEIIYQGNSLETSTFSANMLSFDSASDVVSLINITGTPILNAPVFGNSSQCVRTLLGVSYPDFTTQSGHITYIENRVAVQRSTDGIEQFKFVLEY